MCVRIARKGTKIRPQPAVLKRFANCEIENLRLFLQCLFCDVKKNVKIYLIHCNVRMFESSTFN